MTDKDYTVPALRKGLEILAMFDSQNRSLSQADMAERLGVSSSSLYRIVQTLTGMGYLVKTGTNNYELGSQVVSRGFSYLASREIVEIATPMITKLRDRTSLSAHLGIREHTETLYVFRALALQRLSVNVPVGTRFPCHITAMGRALLFDMSATQLETLYQGQQLDGYPDPSPQTLPALISLIEKERERGWSLHYSDHSAAIAVPVRNFTGEIVAAVNASGPDPIMADDQVKYQLFEALSQTAEEIMRHIGGAT